MKLRILLAGIILLSIFSCRKKAADDYQVYKTTVADSIAKADSMMEVAAKEAAKVVEVPEPVIKGVDLNDKYFIVVASYAVEDFAIGQKKELESQGYKPEIFMLDEDGWYKLAVESYKSLEDAKAAVMAVKERGGIFSQAIIVTKTGK